MPRAFAKKAGYKIVGVWNEIAPGPKQERAERTQEPEFASPEQFAGVPVDIRSDLYSLGVTLWEMLTGKTPFRGTPGEVMHQRQRAPFPVEQLEAVLLETLLKKDPMFAT